MFLEIITPEKKAFSGEVKLVKVPGTAGSFTILDHHAPIISTLEKGVIKVITIDGDKLEFSTDGGVIQMKSNSIILLSETA
ncbi:MAG: F0F1 ATP synthase subunit epsilon [Bacteroidota bacterium]|nr:F0F1 ATP synthase subunit epsilon [Bacteroidota bacterium]MDP4207054.1 F0F1 ATP synthase subunit epsilon [Bacteroidota bacterium]